MSIEDVRRRRLRLLITQFGSQKELSAACGYTSDNYISQILRPGKSFSERAARKIERGAKKPVGWLDIDESADSSPPPAWPFNFDRALWDRLPPARKRKLEEQFETMILGASVQEAATASTRRRPA